MSGLPSSLTSRRQAAAHLPTFELPPPNQFSNHHFNKFPPLSGINSQPLPAAVSVGNLLTPPPNSGSDSGTSSANLTHTGMPVLPYTPSFWQGAGATPGFTSLTPQPWQNGPMFGGRPMFSPSSLGRNDLNSPSSTNALPPPPFELNNVQQYAQGVPLASPGHSHNQTAHHSRMSNQMSGPSPHQGSPVSPADAVSRASTAPGMYAGMTASSTPQPPYGFQNGTPVSQSPHSVGAPTSTTSPPLQHGPIPQIQSPFMKPPYPSYSLPAMPGPILTNIHNPGSQMNLVGNMHQPQMLPMHFNSGYAANPQLAYAQARANSPQQAANQDRPFKCDECPQSFNRNHDLKRHKRIHLAVKPFPCNHCDKSFSRKDALKVCDTLPYSLLMLTSSRRDIFS